MPASSASQWARSSRRRNAGPDSSRWNHSARLRPVVTGMRAMRLVCRFGEWVSDNWHLHIWESALDLSVPHRRPPDNPQLATKCSAEPLEDHRHALAAADAHGFKTQGGVMELQAVQEGGSDARPGHAERVTDRDRPAVHVQL